MRFQRPHWEKYNSCVCQGNSYQLRPISPLEVEETDNSPTLALRHRVWNHPHWFQTADQSKTCMKVDLRDASPTPRPPNSNSPAVLQGWFTSLPSSHFFDLRSLLHRRYSQGEDKQRDHARSCWYNGMMGCCFVLLSPSHDSSCNPSSPLKSRGWGAEPLGVVDLDSKPPL